MSAFLVNIARAHLCDVFLGAGGEVGRGESESTVGPCIVRLEVNGHFLFPPAALAEVKAVHTNEPVGAGDHLHHQRQLPIGERECVFSYLLIRQVINRKHD